MYKILSKLVDECWRYTKPNQCHFWAWLKRPIFGVLDSQGSAETLVRRGEIKKLPFNSIFIQQYLCQKLSKSVDVHWSYSIERHCRFFWDTVYTLLRPAWPMENVQQLSVDYSWRLRAAYGDVGWQQWHSWVHLSKSVTSQFKLNSTQFKLSLSPTQNQHSYCNNNHCTTCYTGWRTLPTLQDFIAARFLPPARPC